MLDIAKRTAVGAGMLLIMPIMVWLVGWQWQPGPSSVWLQGLFWITQTVTQPWGILTSVILIFWFLWCLRFRLRPALGVFVIIILTVLIGQGAKSFIKAQFQEPRPFVVWLEKQYQVDANHFYSLSTQERGRLVEQQLQSQPQIPGWLRSHWQFETGFSFPSGHSVFAATWALLAIGLLWARRHYKTVTVLMVWACGVMASRLALGMHWPQDVIAAILISWGLVVVACGIAQRWCGSLTVLPQETHAVK